MAARRSRSRASIAGAGAAVLAALLVPAFLAVAMAEEGAEAIHLEYRADPGCPDSRSFLARLRSRTDRARLVGPEAATRTFTVEVKAGSPATGHVRVAGRDGNERTRSFQADSCEEVADGLAFVVALAVDARAGEPPPGSGPLVAPPEPSSVALPTSGPGLPPPPPASREELTVTSSQGRRKRTGHFFVGLDLAGATGVTPTALLGGSPFIGWHAATGDFLEASLRGTFLRVGTGTLGVPGGGAQFTWDVGRLDGCLLLFPSLGVGTCLRVEAGELEVDGAGIIDAHSQQSAWIALGALARAEWTVVGPFFVDAGVGLLFRITADRFFFIPNTTVYQIPLLAPEAELGVGIHFL